MVDIINIPELENLTFYGFKLETSVGGLNVDVLNDGAIVKLPQEGYIDDDDYKQYIWSKDTLEFFWGDNGHLMVKFV